MIGYFLNAVIGAFPSLLFHLDGQHPPRFQGSFLHALRRAGRREPWYGTVRLTRKRASEANGGLSYGTLPHPRHHHSRHFHLSQI